MTLLATRMGERTAQAQAVCFVHGFLGDAADWEPVICRLDEGFRCTTYALPGHEPATDGAGATLSEPPSIEATADDLARRAAGAAVVGYSMGGRVALLAAARNPDAMSHLLLIGAHPGIEDARARWRRAAADDVLASRLAQMNADQFRQFLHDWYAAPLFGALAARADFSALVDRRLERAPAQLALALRGLSVGRQPVLWDALPALQRPCCYLAGERDDRYSGVARRIISDTENISSHVIPGAAHATHRERPDAVALHLHALVGRQQP